jgi:hypothetical protein
MLSVGVGVRLWGLAAVPRNNEKGRVVQNVEHWTDWSRSNAVHLLEMLYFSVILCKRQCFIMVTVYTIHGTNIPHVFPHDIFWLDGAIFRYIGVLQSPFSFLLLSPHWPVFAHRECVVCMVFLCPFCKIYCLWDIKNIKILNYYVLDVKN